MLDESLRSEITRPKNIRASYGSRSDEIPPEIQSRFSRLSNLLSKLRSITDQASDDNDWHSSLSQDFELLATAALREVECADFIEKSMETDLTTLRGEIKQKAEALQAQKMEFAGLEETLKTNVAELETRIQKQDAQLKELQRERQQLTTERDNLVNCLTESELTAKQADARLREAGERLEAELSALRDFIAKREEALDARESELHRAEADQRTAIESCQLRLEETEREINEKNRSILAASAREVEIGKLIERLSSECERLSAELCEKTLIISQLETEKRSSLIKRKAWRKLLRWSV